MADQTPAPPDLTPEGVAAFLKQSPEQLTQELSGSADVIKEVFTGALKALVDTPGSLLDLGRQFGAPVVANEEAIEALPPSAEGEDTNVLTNKVRSTLGMKPIEEDSLTETLAGLASSLMNPSTLTPALMATFKGIKSVNFDKGLANTFLHAEDSGALARLSKDKAWERFETFRDPVDQLLRQEIRDDKAQILLNPLKSITPKAPRKLSDILQHDDLFAAYPQFKSMKIEVRDFSNPNVNALYFFPDAQNPQGKIVLSSTLSKGKDDTKLTSTLLHEIQHAIQNYEGFALGGHPSILKDHALVKDSLRTVDASSMSASAKETLKEKLLYDFYRKTAGESESRVTEQRFLEALMSGASDVVYSEHPSLARTRELQAPLESLILSPEDPLYKGWLARTQRPRKLP